MSASCCDDCGRDDLKLYHVFDDGDFFLCYRCKKK